MNLLHKELISKVLYLLKQILIVPIFSEQSVGKFWNDKLSSNPNAKSKILQRIIVQKVFFLILFFRKKSMPAWQGTQNM